MKVVLASANPGKQREFAALLAPLGVQLWRASELGIGSPEETGSTFEANALLKARHAAAAAGLPALADDSGLEVDALGGAPGVYSARYAGANARDTDNNQKLLRELAAVPGPQRGARYRCVLAFVRSADDPAPLLVHAAWEGQIALAPAGNGGFGYDPLFLPQGLQQSAAQLPAELKNTLSHRGQALRQLLAKLNGHVSG